MSDECMKIILVDIENFERVVGAGRETIYERISEWVDVDGHIFISGSCILWGEFEIPKRHPSWAHFYFLSDFITGIRCEQLNSAEALKESIDIDPKDVVKELFKKYEEYRKMDEIICYILVEHYYKNNRSIGVCGQ